MAQAEHIDPATIPVRHGPLTEEAFIADRQHFWTGFTRAVVYAAVAVIALLVVMLVTLV